MGVRRSGLACALCSLRAAPPHRRDVQDESTMYDSGAAFYGTGPASACPGAAVGIRHGVKVCTAYRTVRARGRDQGILESAAADRLARAAAANASVVALLSFGPLAFGVAGPLAACRIAAHVGWGSDAAAARSATVERGGPSRSRTPTHSHAHSHAYGHAHPYMDTHAHAHPHAHILMHAWTQKQEALVKWESGFGAIALMRRIVPRTRTTRTRTIARKLVQLTRLPPRLQTSRPQGPGNAQAWSMTERMGKMAGKRRIETPGLSDEAWPNPHHF